LITVNDRTVSVTRNLEKALRALRRLDQNIVWVDALCINQQDMKERGRQVVRMKDIYSNAALTVAWLGSDHGGNAAMAFKCMRILADGPKDPDYDIIIDDIRLWLGVSRGSPTIHELTAFYAMMKQRYWARTWIIQELILSPNVLFIWGEEILSGQRFQKGIENFTRFRRSEYLRTPADQGWHRVKGVAEMKAQRYNGDNRLKLYEVLSYTSASKAAEPRDKIFGILALCSDASIVRPDYDKPLDTILRELRIAQLERVSSEIKRIRPMDLICVDDPRCSKRPNLSTWVTDGRAFQFIKKNISARLRSSPTVSMALLDFPFPLFLKVCDKITETMLRYLNIRKYPTSQLI
jgi:hypothetical protein